MERTFSQQTFKRRFSVECCGEKIHWDNDSNLALFRNEEEGKLFGNFRSRARTETIRNSATCATRPTACKVSRRGARISPSARPFPNVGAAAPSHYMGERLNGMIGLSLNDRTILPCALTGNGKKLSSSQAQLAYFLSISCEPSILSALYSIPSDLGIRKSR